MVEIQDELEIEIGNKEAVALKPTIVRIEEVKAEEVGTKKAKKIICLCRHPDAQDTIQISAVKYEHKGKLDTVGLWINIDEDKLIRKASALAVFMNYCNVKVPGDLKGKEVPTTQDDTGYLVFKGY